MTTVPHSPRPAVHLLGGAGKTGRRVAARLAGRGHPVRLASRSSELRFDWAHPRTYGAALAGAGAAYLAYYPDISFPGAAAEIRRVAEAAAEQRVRRLVLLSGRGEPDAEPAENALRTVADAYGIDWTIVRCAWFMQNLSEHFLLQPVLDGVIALPAGTVTEPFVDLDDVADVVAAALTRPGHEGRVYDLTGPELLSFAEIARQLSDAIGRPVMYVALAPEEYGHAARAAGVPEEEIAPLVELFARVLDGHNATLSPDLAEVLGRPGGTFVDYCGRTAATGVWDAAVAAGVG